MLNLCTLIKNGKIREIHKYIRNGGYIHTKNTLGSNALHMATKRKYINICEKLLDRGIDPNALDRNSNNVLHLAVEKQVLPLVELYLSKGVDSTALNGNYDSILHIAARKKSYILLNYLFDNNIIFYNKNKDELNPLFCFVINLHNKFYFQEEFDCILNILKKFVDYGFDIFEEESLIYFKDRFVSNINILDILILNNNIQLKNEIFEYFLNTKANNIDDKILMLYSIRYEIIDQVKKFIDKNINIFFTDKYKQTVLDLAKGNETILNLLHNYINKINSNEDYILLKPSEENRIKTINILADLILKTNKPSDEIFMKQIDNIFDILCEHDPSYYNYITDIEDDNIIDKNKFITNFVNNNIKNTFYI